MVRLNEAHLITRYPEELKTLQREFHVNKVKEILASCREVLIWIKTQF